MNKPATSAEILVRLVRPGVEAQDFHLLEGANLADLLRVAGVALGNQAIRIGGVPLEEAVVLADGVVVTVEPRSDDAVVKKPWQMPKLVVDDEALFDEYLEIMKERRRRDDSDGEAIE